MVAYINDLVFDNGLQLISTTADRVFLNVTEPTNYLDATTGINALGNAAATVNAPADGATDGRRVIVDAISGGTVNGDGDANFFSLVDDTAQEIMCYQAISNPQTVSDGNTFSLSQFEVRIPDPTV